MRSQRVRWLSNCACICTHTHTHTHTHITDYHMQGVMGTFLEVKALLITTWSPGLEGANDDGTGPASLQQQLVPRLKRGHMAQQEEGLFAQGQLASLDYFCYFSVLVNLLLDAPLPWWLMPWLQARQMFDGLVHYHICDKTMCTLFLQSLCF